MPRHACIYNISTTSAKLCIITHNNVRTNRPAWLYNWIAFSVSLYILSVAVIGRTWASLDNIGSVARTVRRVFTLRRRRFSFHAYCVTFLVEGTTFNWKCCEKYYTDVARRSTFLWLRKQFKCKLMSLVALNCLSSQLWNWK